MAAVLSVSKSGYYRWKRRVGKGDPEDKSLMDLVRSIYIEHRKRYGYRRITKEIKRRGIAINHKHVYRIMKAMGLKAIFPKKFKKTTNSDHKLPVAENLIKQEFAVAPTQQVWLSDITYVRTLEGWLYLSVVMDLYSRRIMGWDISETLAKESVIAAFRKAAERYEITADAIFHSDRGVQFASEEFREALEQHGFRQSMSGTGNCYDNAPMESFFHTLKNELLLRDVIDSKYRTRITIFEYLEFYYNKKRLHSSLKYKTPDEVYLNK